MATLMPSGGPDTFTGADWSSWNWSNWFTGFNNNPATQTNQGSYTSIMGNRGMMVTGPNLYDRLSLVVNISPRRDAEIVFDWVVPDTGQAFPRVLARGLRELDIYDCYYFTLQAGKMEAGRYSTSYVETTLTSQAHAGTTPGQVMRTRISCFGSSLKARTWIASNQEPTATWNINLTDTLVSRDGYFGFTQSNNTAGQKQFYIDNFDILDGQTAQINRGLYEGWISPQGSYTKVVPKSFASSTMPSGEISVRRVIVRAFAGFISTSGTVTSGIVKVLTGSIAPSANLSKSAKKVLTGTIGINATLGRFPSLIFNSVISIRGNLRSRNAGRVFGKPGIAVIKVLKAGHARARIRKG